MFLHFTQKFKMAAKNGRKTNFLEKSPVDSGDTLWVKNVVEIALSSTVSKINVFLSFMLKLKMAAKNGGKMIFFGKFTGRLFSYPMGQKFCRKRSISHRFQDKCIIAFYAVIEDGRKNGGKMIFRKSLQ